MSNDLVEEIHLRLRAEIARCGLSMAAASRAAGESGPQRLKDVIAGRQKCPIELLARLAPSGVDLIYVLTGEESANRPTSAALPLDEEMLLDAYRGLSAPKKKELLGDLLRGGARKKPEQPVVGVVVTGSGNRTAGNNYHEKE